ncbi:MAG: URC4/urg3 family protein [Pseudomonadota bacterium]
MTDTTPAPGDSQDHTLACAAPSDVALLRSTRTIRERAQALLARARHGDSRFFAVNDGALFTTATVVAQLTRARYPDLGIPYHSRWRHFEAGGVDRTGLLNAALPDDQPVKRARAQIDLAVVSVLLDAGAGPNWRFVEKPHDSLHIEGVFTRSEGLGVASFHAFMRGLFSSDPDAPMQADANGLQQVTAQVLAEAFQVTPKNPMVGLEGRAALLRRLGETLANRPEIFGSDGRPGRMFDVLAGAPPAEAVRADDILEFLLDKLSPIWPSDNQLAGAPLGDCWRHGAAVGAGATSGWMPFHKLSQWLTYSLLEPFEWAGVRVEGLESLTGLPEYRNGGLFLDSGVLRLKDPAVADQPHAVGEELIVEWRALTIALLDELAPLVREQLYLTASQLPLACVLEGGTWAAGRVLAQQLRGGSPPLAIESDGTVF